MKHIGWSILGYDEVWHVGKLPRKKSYCIYVERGASIVPIAWIRDEMIAEEFIRALEKTVIVASREVTTKGLLPEFVRREHGLK